MSGFLTTWGPWVTRGPGDGIQARELGWKEIYFWFAFYLKPLIEF